METIKFKITLLSDAVLSASPATDGGHSSLDFIPGNNFLGIAAAQLYAADLDRAYTLFHSGKVRFGDAHPAAGDTRTLRIPAAIYYPKLKKVEDNDNYINHLIPNPDADEIRSKQPKQCRAGFYAFPESGLAKEVSLEKNFAIKSAYEEKRRGGKDNKDDNKDDKSKALFGYESIPKGSEFYFEVEIDDEAKKYSEDIIKALVGKKHIGRSRSAEYGLAKIERFEYSEPKSTDKSDSAKDNEYTVYADGRLIFFDENGMPTFRPTAEDLGFPEGKDAEILWEKSQVRKFQYAPWNFTRQAYDSERCGIEKGSVFVVKAKVSPAKSAYVGAFNNEGFGKVIYNPAFLEADSNGKAKVQFGEKQKDEPQPISGEKATAATSCLIAFLERKKKENEAEKSIYDIVNKFVEENENNFQGERFASQWGTIRGIAMATPGPQTLMELIFGQDKADENEKDKGKKEKQGYLDHGVAKEKWDERRRRKTLKDTLVTFLNNDKNGKFQDFVINLASEMAKKCRNDK